MARRLINTVGSDNQFRPTKTEVRPLLAETSGIFAINETECHDGEAHRWYPWTVTHRPTGFCLIRCRTRQDAREAVKELKALKTDWRAAQDVAALVVAGKRDEGNALYLRRMPELHALVRFLSAAYRRYGF